MILRMTRLFRSAGRDLVTLWYACRHPATPWLLKVAAALLGVYVLSPVDLVPDWFPILGWIDDVTLLAFGIPALLKLAPQHALRDARAASDGILSRWRLF